MLSRDESTGVAAQLRDLERQGGGMARLAHLCAGFLLAAFSLGSLISISAAAFFRFLAAWDAGHADLPDAISLVVNVLLVLAADVALLYAASVLRVLVTSGAPLAEQRVHRWAMLGACVLESSTYLYLVWSFDRPTTLFLWAIGIGRALASPLCAAYLSMARALPVGPRDVAYQAALAAGRGVVRDVTVLAGDASAPLERKVRIYSASALMAPQDRTRFDAIVEAVRLDDPAPDPVVQIAPAPPDLPTGPGTPARASKRRRKATTRKRPTILRLQPPDERVRVALASEPELSIRALARAAHVSQATASKWRRVLVAEREGQAAQ